MSWEKVKIRDLGKVVTGKTPPTKQSDYYGGTVPFITPVDMVGERSIFETQRFLTEKGKDCVRNCLLPANSVCVSCIGSDMGKVVLTTQPSVTNQQINSIKVYDKYSYKFVYYLMLTCSDRIKSLGKNATAVPILNKSRFEDIDVLVPDLRTQKRIAYILSAYDDLIEVNRKQIKLLEEAAERLYREWFIDLHFPGHENTPIIDGLPQGWIKSELTDDIVPIVTGKKDANFGGKDGEYLFFTCSQEPIKANSYSFNTSAVILAGNGDFNVKLYRGKFEAYQRTYVLSPRDVRFLYLLYYCVSDNMRLLAKGARGSTIKFLTKGMIEKLEMFIPSIEVLDKFNAHIESIQSKIENLKNQINNATAARDMLLPRLMNGEINL